MTHFPCFVDGKIYTLRSTLFTRRLPVCAPVKSFFPPRRNFLIQFEKYIFAAISQLLFLHFFPLFFFSFRIFLFLRLRRFKNRLG